MLQLTFEYMPYYYDDDLQLIPNDFSNPDNLRFVIEQDYTSAFSIFTNPDDELSSFESSFLEQWFHRLQDFPLFVCVEVNRYDEEEFEALCRFYSITYNDLTPLADKRFIVAELKHAEDFQRLYSYIHPHASWNDLVILSSGQPNQMSSGLNTERTTTPNDQKKRSSSPCRKTCLSLRSATMQMS